jgi:hypothetical protein
MEPEEPAPEDEVSLPEEPQPGFWTIGNIIRLVVFGLSLAIFLFVVLKPKRRARVSSFFERLSQQSAIRIEKGFNRLGVKAPAFVRNWALLTGLNPIKRAYLEINRALKRLGREAKGQETPAERASGLIKILPTATEPVTRLVEEYQTATYSLHLPDTEAARHASGKVRELSYREIIKRLVIRLKYPRGNRSKYGS